MAYFGIFDFSYPTTPLKRSTTIQNHHGASLTIWLTSYYLSPSISFRRKTLFFLFIPSLPVVFQFLSLFNPSATMHDPSVPQTRSWMYSQRRAWPFQRCLMTQITFSLDDLSCLKKPWVDLTHHFGTFFSIHVSPFRSSTTNEWLRLVAHPIIRIPSSKGIG